MDHDPVEPMTYPTFPALLQSVREHADRPQHIEGLYHLQRDAVGRFTEVVFTEPLVPSIRVFGFKLRTPNRSPRVARKKWCLNDQQLVDAPQGALDELLAVFGTRATS